MTEALRAPRLHVLGPGAAVLGLLALLDGMPLPGDGQGVAVTVDDARRRAAASEATWRRPPVPDRRDHLVAQHRRMEVSVREVPAPGLDDGDAVIRRRLLMTMAVLAETGAQTGDPDDATPTARPRRPARAPRLGFEPSLPGMRRERASVTGRRASLNGGRAPLAVGRPRPLPPAFPASPHPVLDGPFGTGVFVARTVLPARQRARPVATPLGRHPGRLARRRDGGLPPLAAIHDRVRRDGRAIRASELRAARLGAMGARRPIAPPDAAEVLGR